MKGVLIILAVCGFAAAMLARDERALDSEAISTSDATSTSDASSTTTISQICAQETPCAWIVYNKVNKRQGYKIKNTYCVCSSNLTCLVNEEDPVSHTYVMRCRVPSKDSTSEEEFDLS